MNCWVCGGHGHVVTGKHPFKIVHVEVNTHKDKLIPDEIAVCHYCAGSGMIEVEE